MNVGLRLRLWLVAFAAILGICGLLSGCQVIRDSSVVFENTQTSFGGHDLGSGVNLKDITVINDGKATVITMYFIHGSRNSTVAETILNAVPAYSATLLPVPERLCVKLAVDYWDYQKNDDWYRNSLIYGSFKTTAPDDNQFSIYFQLNGDVSATFRENADRLIITLTPKNSQTNQQYYVGLNAFEEFEQNLIPLELGFTPTLCSDSSNVMLISGPFASQSDADVFSAKVSNEIAGVAATKKPYTFTLGTGSLPVYNATIDMEEVNQKQVLQVDGKGQPLPVLVQNGRYLCTSPDGNILYARSYPSGAIADVSGNQNERLWVLGQNNKKTELGFPNFSNVEQAAYSPDGKYLAILDASARSKVLYVYIPETKELKNLGEEGFGNVTASFAWDTGRDIIYAMTGQSSMQLLSYDLDKPAGLRIARVGEILGTETSVAINGKNIYYADPSGGSYGQVFSVGISSGIRSPVTSGIGFKLSPDGNYLAVLTLSDTGNQEMFDLNMVNLSSGATQTVMKSIYVEDYEFSLDSSELFYTTSTYEGIGSAYHNALLRYSVAEGTSRLVGYSTADILRRSQGKNELYLIDYFDAQPENFYVTYIYRYS